LILFSLVPSAYGQIGTIELSGQVLSRETFKPLPLINVINLRDRTGTVTNKEGKFKLRVRTSDTVILSSVDHIRDTLTFDHLSSKQHFVQILLTPKVYVLREVEVGELGNYDKLKNQILEWERNKKRTARAFIEEPEPIRTEAPEKIPATWSSPFDMLYETFGKRPQQLRKLAELERRDAYEAAVQYRFTPYVVNSLTGLEGDELVKFMQRCRFSYEFIFTSSDYEFYMAILDYYKAYESDKARREQDYVDY